MELSTGVIAEHLRRGGTSVVLRLEDTELPCLLYWGTDLGDVETGPILEATARPVGDSVVYANPVVALLPRHSSGWLGRPGLVGSRAGRSWSVSFDAVTHDVTEACTPGWPDGAPGAVRVRSTGTDAVNGLVVTTELELHASGLLRLRAGVRNTGPDGYEVVSLLPALPVGEQANELLDMTGRHSRERTPQRRPFDQGSWVREAWGGRPGHDSATMLCAGESGFGFRRGRVWGVHLAWSGNQVLTAERSPSGWRLLRGGELLLPGERVLAHDEEYWSPWLVASWGEGLDELSSRVHRFLRARPQHPRSARPVLLNVWEAVYFDHDLPHLLDLAEKAAAVGVERYVLDDGWFRGRRDDTAGLGDWYVDDGVWPDGLAPLTDRVHELGMQFGLWFEPEMVSLDSDLAREHPEWLFGTGRGPGVPSRQQHVLDLGHPGAFDHVLERMSELVARYGVDFVKWDHNRPLVDAGHQPTGVPGVHVQTLATYRLMDALKSRFPGLEIESCCGGGGRIDLGVMERCDRVWVSDNIDAHERQRMQRWTSLLLPPELLGTHVGSARDHTTGRSLDLDFRAGTAVWGHLGVEWDLSAVSDTDLDELAEWVAVHKSLRDLLHTGDVVRADPTDPAVQVEGVVAADRSEAAYRVAVVEHPLTDPPGRITLPGLDPGRTYRVELVAPSDGAVSPADAPAWVKGVELGGRVLEEVGLVCPRLAVDTLVLLRVTAVRRSAGR
ncbi:alpha-galactosidase [Promicromonospora sp. NPDC060271]|uniref:alpha-galactosidase n=1 Tax=Promicromonospora sp. NPDC060271 TaxID=3347089 RepID=UPI003657E263